MWAVIAFITGTVVAGGQNTLGRSPAVEPQKARTQSHSGPRPCLSLEDIDGSHPRYRVVGGRRCWYASKGSASAKSHKIDISTHDDPIWQDSEIRRSIGTSGANGGSQTSSDHQAQARNCEEQALKLFDPEEIKQGSANEKSMFIKQCMSN
jgi:hypothetical protein